MVALDDTGLYNDLCQCTTVSEHVKIMCSLQTNLAVFLFGSNHVRSEKSNTTLQRGMCCFGLVDHCLFEVLAI